MPERTVREIECKSMLNRVNIPSLDFRWSVNPYRGCEHKCVYCFARRYHEWFELDAGADFETQLFVKVNAPQVLRRELCRKRWRQERVAIGTAVDPYQPLEGKYRLTRALLEAFLDYWTPCSLVTKNTMVLRDLDVLQELARGPGCTVYFSITTVDRDLAAQIEPDTPPPGQRLRVMQALVEAGVDAGVMLAPVLPGLTDDRAQLDRVIWEAAAHGARFLHAGVLRLDGSVKQVYRGFLRRAYPRLLQQYAVMYPGSRAPADYQEQIEARVADSMGAYGLHRERLHDARVLDRKPMRRNSSEGGRPPLQLRLAVDR